VRGVGGGRAGVESGLRVARGCWKSARVKKVRRVGHKCALLTRFTPRAAHQRAPQTLAMSERRGVLGQPLLATRLVEVGPSFKSDSVAHALGVGSDGPGSNAGYRPLPASAPGDGAGGMGAGGGGDGAPRRVLPGPAPLGIAEVSGREEGDLAELRGTTKPGGAALRKPALITRIRRGNGCRTPPGCCGCTVRSLEPLLRPPLGCAACTRRGCDFRSALAAPGTSETPSLPPSLTHPPVDVNQTTSFPPPFPAPHSRRAPSTTAS
jgi:hypothetical protein